MTQTENDIVIACIKHYITDRKFRVVSLPKDGSNSFQYEQYQPRELTLNSSIEHQNVLTLARKRSGFDPLNNAFGSRYRNIDLDFDEDSSGIFMLLRSNTFVDPKHEQINVGKFYLVRKNNLASYKKSLRYSHYEDYLTEYTELNKQDEKIIKNPFKYINSITSYYFLYLIFGSIDNELQRYGFPKNHRSYVPFGIQKPNSADLFYELRSDGTYPKPTYPWPNVSKEYFYELTQRGSLRRVNPRIQFRKLKDVHLQYLKTLKGVSSDYYETIRLISCFNSTEILYLLSKFYDKSNTSGNSLKPGHFKMISSKLALKTLCL